MRPEPVSARRPQLPPEPNRDRVDGEVPAPQVLPRARRGDVRQRPRVRVGLAARSSEVVGVAVELDGGGPEPVVDPRPAEAPRKRGGVSVDQEVELVRPPAEQEVPDSPADQVDALGVGQRPKERAGGRERLDLLDQPRWRRNVHAGIFARGADGRVGDCPTAWLVASMRVMPSSGSRRLLRVGLVAVAVLLLVVAGAVAFVLLHTPGNVSHPNLSFTLPPTTSTTVVPPPKKKVVVNDFEWPRYGYDAARTRFFPGAQRVHPPFRVGWRYEDHALLEFPPVIYQNTLYQLDDDASIKAINKLNGHLIWQHKIGTLAAASPALGIKQHLLFVSILSKASHSPGNGSLDAISMKSGRIVWSHPLPAGTESSPMAWGSSVYFGDQSGTVYSLRGRSTARARELDLSRQRRDQGGAGARQRRPLLRRLRRPRIYALNAEHRPPDLGR